MHSKKADDHLRPQVRVEVERLPAFYFRNKYQKSSPCESIKKWSTAVKYAMQMTSDISA